MLFPGTLFLGVIVSFQGKCILYTEYLRQHNISVDEGRKRYIFDAFHCHRKLHRQF
jgi:hypothetical protein